MSSYHGSPGGAAPVTAEPKDDHPHQGHDEAEDGDKHHPGKWVVWHNVFGRHQDPHQTAEHLHGGRWKDACHAVETPC